MDTRKLTLVATVAVIALVFVGIGYAYVAYSSNSGNTSDTAYVTLTQTGEGAYKFANNAMVELETFNETNSTKFYYKLSDPLTIDTSATDYYVAVLGKITLHADFQGSVTPKPSQLDVTITTSEGFDANSTWQYFLTGAPSNGVISTLYAHKSTSSETKVWTEDNDLTIAGNNGTFNDVTVYVCYGYPTTAETQDCEGISFLPTGDAYMPKELAGASIVFKADSNATVTYNANNGAATVPTVTVKAHLGQNYTLAADSLGLTGPADKPTFVGWGATPTSTDKITTAQMINGDVTYYAIWAEAE